MVKTADLEKKLEELKAILSRNFGGIENISGRGFRITTRKPELA